MNEEQKADELSDMLRLIIYDAKTHREHCKILQTKTTGADGYWADHGTTSANEIDLRFENITLTLRTNGTYCFRDSSGG